MLEIEVVTLSLVSSLRIAINLLINNFLWVLIGVIAGMFFGVIPGMGGTVTLSILLPFTLGMDPIPAFTLLAASWGAVQFAGSISAILINSPGTGGNAATLLDGYPLSRQGQAARAIGAAATASGAGAIVGLILFLVLIPVVAQIALAFGPSEVFWLILMALAVVPLVTGDKPIAGIATAGMGLIVSFIGQVTATAELRFVYGQIFLYDGIGLIPPMVGLFAVSEMARLGASENDTIADPDESTELVGNKIDGIRDVIKNRWLWFRSSIIGLVIGAMPGVGAMTATFLAYGHAVQLSDDPESFGKGNIKGVIASEAANDSKAGGHLFPTLGLGIPGSAAAAVLLGGLLVHGITPGPSLLADKLPLVLVITLSLLASNILTSIIGLSITGVFVKITKVPLSNLFPAIVILALIATFVMRNLYTDMIVMLLFAALGLIMMDIGISRVPIIIAIVLGGLLEQKFHTATSLAGGDSVQALFGSPLDKFLVLVCLAFIFFPIWQLLISRLRARVQRS
jgi:putative tricarboxylic transport membrane protein